MYKKKYATEADAIKAFLDTADIGKKNACWTVVPNSQGYRRVWFQGKKVLAHRLSAYIFKIIPSLDAPHGKGRNYVTHDCDNKACINPDHLSNSTIAANNREARERGLNVAPKGAAAYQAKMTDKDVREIRIARARGVKLKDLAIKFGVDISNISRADRGQHFADSNA